MIGGYPAARDACVFCENVKRTKDQPTSAMAALTATAATLDAVYKTTAERVIYYLCDDHKWLWQRQVSR